MRLPYNKHGVVLRAASGNLTANETSPEVDTKNYHDGVVDLRVTELIMANGGGTPAEVDFYIQVELNGTWVDVANVHFDFGDEPIAGASRLIGIGPKAVGTVVITPTDGTIADDTDADIPLGQAVRIKVIVTPDGGGPPVPPTYAYSALLTLHG